MPPTLERALKDFERYLEATTPAEIAQRSAALHQIGCHIPNGTWTRELGQGHDGLRRALQSYHIAVVRG